MNHCKCLITIGILWVFLFAFSSKLVGQAVVLSSGNSAVSDSGSVSYSIGQVSFRSVNSTNGSISEGVQHAIILEEITTITQSPNLLDIVFYPNPTNHDIFIVHKNSNNLDYEMLDINSKKLGSGKLNGESSKIELSSFPVGVYFIKIYDSQRLVTRTFKIIKR